MSTKIIKEHLVDHLPHLRKIVYKIAKDQGVVDDLTQECCLHIIEKEKLWGGKINKLSQWMNTVTRNLTIKKLSKAKREKKQKDPFFEEEIQAQELEINEISQEQIRWVLSQFETLPQMQKKILHLKYFKGLKSVDIAKELELSPKTVSTHLTRALDALKKRARAQGLLTAWIPWLENLKPNFSWSFKEIKNLILAASKLVMVGAIIMKAKLVITMGLVGALILGANLLVDPVELIKLGKEPNQIVLSHQDESSTLEQSQYSKKIINSEDSIKANTISQNNTEVMLVNDQSVGITEMSNEFLSPVFAIQIALDDTNFLGDGAQVSLHQITSTGKQIQIKEPVSLIGSQSLILPLKSSGSYLAVFSIQEREITLQGEVSVSDPLWKITSLPLSTYSLKLTLQEPIESNSNAHVKIYQLRENGTHSGRAITSTKISEGQDQAQLPLLEPGSYQFQFEYKNFKINRQGKVDFKNPHWKVSLNNAGSNRLYGHIFKDSKEEDPTLQKVWGEKDFSVKVYPLESGRQGHYASDLDEYGDYQIEGLPNGIYALVIPKKGFAKKIILSRGETQQDIYLPIGTIEGRIFNKQTNEPLSNIQVVYHLQTKDHLPKDLRAFIPDRLFSDRRAPDKEGYYKFENLPPGTYSFFANGSQYGNQHQSVILGQNEFKTVNFAMELGSTIDLSVVNEFGQTLTPIAIFCAGISWGFQGPASGLKPGTWDMVVASPKYGLGLKQKVTFPPGEVIKVEFTLKPSLPTKVIFVDASGQALPGVSCQVIMDNVDVQLTTASSFSRMGLPSLPFRVSNEKGEIEIRLLGPGSYLLKAKKEGYQDIVQEIELKEGQDTLTIELKKTSAKF